MLACVGYRRQLALVAEHDNGNGREIAGLASFFAAIPIDPPEGL